MELVNENALECENDKVVPIYEVEQLEVNEKYSYLLIKRIFDFFASLVAFIVLLPIMLILCVLIPLDSKGPVVYAQERLGKNGKPFMIYKFRTMNLNAEDDGPKWASNDDERCTKVGKILRKYRLDELPQFLNIIKGDMSLVGPRPERKYFYDEFEKYIPGFSQRLLVQPGLTGHDQVNGGYDLKPEEKIVYDIEYIKQRSIIMDLKCIFKTIEVVFTNKGAR